MTTPEARFARWRLTGVIVWSSIGILVLLSAALWMFGRIASAFIPFVIAFIIVFLLNAPVRLLERKGMRRGLAAALCLVLGIAAFATIITFLLPTVVKQTSSLAEKAPQYFLSLERLVTLWQGRFSAMVFPGWVSQVIQSSSSQISQGAVTVGNGVAGSLVTVGGGFANGIFDIVLALVIAFWALRDLPKIREEIGLLAGPRYGADVEHMSSTVTRVVGGYLKGQTIASLCTGLLATIGLAIIGVPYAILLGLVTTVFNFVPYVGPFTAGALAALVALIANGPWSALLAIGIIVGAQNVTDTFITPRIMSEQVDLHPTLVIFSLLVGGTLFGIPGMLFAIPVAATAKGLFVYYYERQTDRQIATQDGALFRSSACDPDDEESDVPCEPSEDASVSADDAR
jgi:predicted PurR-regulated permease PerM